MKDRLTLIREILVDQLGCSESAVIPAAWLRDDLGMDSLDAVELLMAFEEALGIAIGDEDAEGIKSVNDIYELLAKLLGPEFPENGLLSLTDDQFVNRYKPETYKNGELYVQREWSTDRALLEAAVETNRCWTAIDDDFGRFCFVEGNRMVNRIYNIITERPLENPEWMVQVYDPDDGEGDDEEDESEEHIHATDFSAENAATELPHYIQTMYVFALRYLHNRETAGVSLGIETVEREWHRLSRHTQEQIQKETTEATYYPELWAKLRKLPLKK